ncbi:MAG: hypothetical protein BGO88_08430 [Flavobacterium sp. 38-13]|uniref:hypothetical protein n=1 Tax=Flavobacterium sp. 38-13 TaxID=1896168 RepID=UPI000962CCEF|nr:hypothetical protein [Flavobacterium sp. 38-13]OJX49772.1 MAG: hypothetical protein BGO88_08430 [Flavobacterium sp. 38-13]
MANPVTAWSATVQRDIEESEHLFELAFKGYNLQLFNCGDSLWLVCRWPEAGRIAFRIAFGMNSNFESASVSEHGGTFLITASTRLGYYRIVLSTPESQAAIFRYTTTFRAKLPLLIPFWPRDIVPLTRDGRIENTAGIIHSHQVGTRSGQIFFSMTKPQAGSVLYFQNLGSMSAYCEATEVSLGETVGGSWPEIGFRFPVNPEKALPQDKEYIISDAFVLVGENVPSKDCDIASQFLGNLAAIYSLLPKPDPVYHDWPSTAKKILGDLHKNKGCWTQTNGIPYLNAYVGDYATPSEIMVQLAVLLPLHEYLDWSGTRHPVFDDLESGISQFYDERVGTVVRWHPDLEDGLDKSEEQKREMVMDSWYLHHPLLNLSRLALRGSETAKRLFLDSIDYAINVARHFDYEWPVFYKMTTLEVLKAETSPGNGGEKDVPGSYAHIMLMAYKLTGEKRFLREAAKALRSLEGLTFDIFYQANNTAFAAAALVELYKETGQHRYLELSYCCLAGIFKNCQIWDCGYGFAKNFPNFFAVFPLNDAPYTAAYEELEVFAALHHYMEASEGLEILPSLRVLIPEFIRYATGRLAFYYPPMLPEEMIAEDVKTGEVQKGLWIPLEDIHDGWEKSGEVGQEVYGAGIAFGIIPRQYFKINGLGATIYLDYPVTRLRNRRNSATFHIAGSPDMRANMIIQEISRSQMGGVTVEQKLNGRYRRVQPKPPGVFDLAGSGLVRIKWGKP